MLRPDLSTGLCLPSSLFNNTYLGIEFWSIYI
jgi:hypothetical protein